jgi:hypothetical protein
MRRLRERQAVSDNVVEPNLALLDLRKQFVDVVLYGRLLEAHRDALRIFARAKNCHRGFLKRRRQSPHRRSELR